MSDISIQQIGKVCLFTSERPEKPALSGFASRKKKRAPGFTGRRAQDERRDETK
ncbi:MAG: hypothetical protein LBB55_05385 [Zoogloeaceae bacterium]|jgi:hypothetical protein|nr:hypothetical protein [Zoogloeaceae bacterium]